MKIDNKAILLTRQQMDALRKIQQGSVWISKIIVR
ncbi:hypothetical protein Xentx_02894 [Xenorhabdus thuongxuanensis]|uniref:Uncharacterized protein n=1 Tax=Xenorhabdus thuongxuanensis TaxID=1873484 RepID=A0A1Q5TU44_9GAMM|nr:hypothetical protein Xentx_02894 [Xenorhabdus thuongxuanensis]